MAIIKYKFLTCQFWMKEEEIRFKNTKQIFILSKIFIKHISKSWQLSSSQLEDE